MWSLRRNRHRKRKQYPSDAEEIAMDEYSRDQIETAIYQWINGRNGERDRVILGMYLLDGITFRQMQERLEAIGYPLSIDQIKKIVRKRKEQFFRHV
jgi:hypothetical protein